MRAYLFATVSEVEQAGFPTSRPNQGGHMAAILACLLRQVAFSTSSCTLPANRNQRRNLPLRTQSFAYIVD